MLQRRRVFNAILGAMNNANIRPEVRRHARHAVPPSPHAALGLIEAASRAAARLQYDYRSYRWAGAFDELFNYEYGFRLDAHWRRHNIH